MYLKRSITVNWGNIPSQELDYGPVNLFSGGNGSGKTTTADALQTLMTAAHENLFHFNPGQDETTQKGRGGKQVRTLASYVLGCDDGSYARPYDSDSYLAAIFHPTQGERGEPFTAVVAIRAHLDRAGNSAQARQDDLQFFILPGVELSITHFIRTSNRGREVVPLEEIEGALTRELGKSKVEKYDKKKAYLRRLYGALRGKQRDSVSDREALHAAKTFSSFMAYKPVRSIDDFVAQEVLERKEMGETLRQVQGLLKSVHSMEQEAQQLEDSVNLLDTARQQSNAYVETWLDRCTAKYGEAEQSFRANQTAYINAKQKQSDTRLQVTASEQELEQTRAHLESTLNELISIEARRRGIAALRTKDQLEQEISDTEKDLHERIVPLLQADKQVDTNTAAAQNIARILAAHSLGQEVPELDQKSWRDSLTALLSTSSSERPDLHKLLTNDWINLDPLEGCLEKIIQQERVHNQLADRLLTANDKGSTLLQRVGERVSTREQSLKQLEPQLQQLTYQIGELEQARVRYPDDVVEALRAINSQRPEADARVLCDYVEVTDPKWQMAIEGYLGGNRFSILVDPAYEAEAIRIVRGLKGRGRNKARVIQGSKARQDAERLSVPEHSILKVMSFTNKVAEYYLRASYGTVLRVDNPETLRTTPRGITADGMASGGYSMWRCDLGDAELVFGQEARRRALVALKGQQQDLYEQRAKANDAYQAVYQLHQQLRQIAPILLATLTQEMVKQRYRLSQITNELQLLDLSEHRDLEEASRVANELRKSLEATQASLNQRIGQLNTQIKSCETEIKHHTNQRETLQRASEAAEQALRDAVAECPGLDPDKRLSALDQRLQDAQDKIDFSIEAEQLSNALIRHLKHIEDALGAYNQRARPADQIMYTCAEELHSIEYFRHLNRLNQQIENIFNRLKNNVLLDKKESLSALRDSFNTTFITDLCLAIHQAVQDGERSLKNLNKELQHHRFGADKEWFEFDWQWVPEFKEYWDFLKEVVSLPNLGDGASLFTSELSPESQQIRDKMLALLLEGDEAQALRDLERISDYRHYRRYDILKHPEGKSPIRLSEYGTGSGGQLETPAYIIRAAAITSAFHFNEGDTHLRMVIVDEAFMHMDESRSREVINYLTETLGLQLIFIMPTSKSGPFLELISNQFIFSKIPSAVPVGELRTRVIVDRQELNKERIAELWSNHRRVIRQQAALDFMADV